MFKAPKYRRFLDPYEIPAGYLQSLGTKEVSDKDFRTAMTEAYWLFSLAIDQHTAARMRRQSRVGVAGATTRAETKAAEQVERRRGEILWLLAGLMGLHLPSENAASLERAKELCDQAKKRSQDAERKARLKQGGQTMKIGFPVAFYGKNPPKRRW